MDAGARGYNILGTWIEANGYQIVGPGRELFLEISWPHEGNNIMEIQFPVDKVDTEFVYS